MKRQVERSLLGALVVMGFTACGGSGDDTQPPGDEPGGAFSDALTGWAYNSLFTYAGNTLLNGFEKNVLGENPPSVNMQLSNISSQLSSIQTSINEVSSELAAFENLFNTDVIDAGLVSFDSAQTSVGSLFDAVSSDGVDFSQSTQTLEEQFASNPSLVDLVAATFASYTGTQSLVGAQEFIDNWTGWDSTTSTPSPTNSFKTTFEAFATNLVNQNLVTNQAWAQNNLWAYNSQVGYYALQLAQSADQVRSLEYVAAILNQEYGKSIAVPGFVTGGVADTSAAEAIQNINAVYSIGASTNGSAPVMLESGDTYYLNSNVLDTQNLVSGAMTIPQGAWQSSCTVPDYAFIQSQTQEPSQASGWATQYGYVPAQAGLTAPDFGTSCGGVLTLQNTALLFPDDGSGNTPNYNAQIQVIQGVLYPSGDDLKFSIQNHAIWYTPAVTDNWKSDKTPVTDGQLLYGTGSANGFAGNFFDYSGAFVQGPYNLSTSYLFATGSDDETSWNLLVPDITSGGPVGGFLLEYKGSIFCGGAGAGCDSNVSYQIGCLTYDVNCWNASTSESSGVLLAPYQSGGVTATLQQYGSAYNGAVALSSD